MLGIIVFATVLSVLSVLTISRPHIAIVGLLCMFGLEQLGQIYIPFLRTYGTLTNLYVLILLIIALGLTYRSQKFIARPNCRQSKVAFLSTVLYVVALVTLLWTPVDGWAYWKATWPYLIAHILIAAMLIRQLDDLEQVQKTFIWLGGIVLLFMATVPDWGNRSLIVAGEDEDLGLPLGLAQMSGYLLIIGTIHFRKNYLSAAWLVVAILAALVVAIKTASRGQTIFSVLSILLVTPLVWRRMTPKHVLQLSLMASLIALATYYIFQTTGSFTQRWQGTALLDDLSHRLGLVSLLLSEWISSPKAIIFGLGNSSSFSDDLVGGYPHVVPLEILGEEGIVGFLLFIAIIYVAFRQAKRFHALTFLSKDVKRVYAANFGCFLFTLLLSCKQGSLMNSSEIFLFAALGEKYLNLIQRELYRSKVVGGRRQNDI
jgi:hypothetical protein